jgi:hypothetical protein
LSFEFFPPKTEAGFDKLLQAVSDLMQLKPSYASVTYGAGGSTRDYTTKLVVRIKKEKWGHPLKGLSREKTPLPSKKIHLFFRLASYFRASTASLYCHLFSHPLFLFYRLAVSPS